MRIRTGGQGGSVDIPPGATRDCDQKDVRVFVDGSEIPTVDTDGDEDQAAVEVQVRKDGPADITRLSDVYFPAEWRGYDIIGNMPFGANDRSVPVRIEARPPGEDDFQTIHYGFLRKIGSGGDGRLLRMRVDDYSKILAGTRISHTFGSGSEPSVESVLNVVTRRLSKKEIDIDYQTGDVEVERPQTQFTVDDIIGFSPVGFRVPAAKSFQSNRDTLVDVMEWLMSKIDGGKWWVDYIDGEPTIVVSQHFEPSWTTTEAGGSLTVRKNMALYDIAPINTVQIHGKTGTSVYGFNVPLSGVVSDSYPVAKATHGELFARADNTEYVKEFETDAMSIDQAKADAKKKLREVIGGAGEGYMRLDGNPGIVPWGTIEARPVCDDFVEADVPTLTFGIERVKHKLPSTERFQTVIDVGIHVDDGDISVTGSMADAEGTTQEDSRAAALETLEDLEDIRVP